MKVQTKPVCLKVMIMLASIIICMSSQPAIGGGVTVITHGQNSEAGSNSWVRAMGDRIPDYQNFPGTNYTMYRIYFYLSNNFWVSTWERVAGTPPTTTDSGEIIVLLDWEQLANNSYSTIDIAPVFAARLLDGTFIPETQGHALAELPMHFIGHSRGGSLICEMSKLLGTQGVWVDHVTTLDAYSLSEDALVNSYENVLFHDNVRQDGCFAGDIITGSYDRRLGNLTPLGFGGYTLFCLGSHSDIHLWYHGTVELVTPASDYNVDITSSMRNGLIPWWVSYEQEGTNAGFIYSLIGGANRLSTDIPAPLESNRVIDGYNQRFDLGAGVNSNRVALPSNNGSWPNPITCDVISTNILAWGDTLIVQFHHQYAMPLGETATARVLLDEDVNPWNGNETIVEQSTIFSSDSEGVNLETYAFPLPSTIGAGTYYVVLQLDNGLSRYRYAQQAITIISIAPMLEIRRLVGETVEIATYGNVGETLVLESSNDLSTWSSLATNQLTSSPWIYTDTSTNHVRLYRAQIQ